MGQKGLDGFDHLSGLNLRKSMELAIGSPYKYHFEDELDHSKTYLRKPGVISGRLLVIVMPSALAEPSNARIENHFAEHRPINCHHHWQLQPQGHLARSIQGL